ncbi:MAG: hybrid sensor histidine kinase/response regulator, partial [Candidatus Dadabacteria bacterium]|nr:hybrid sensor histidine kinase/response regulator [Candidatus Dadabacteria bacterium]
SNFIEVSITDSGPGINVGDDINVFDSFYTTKKSGLGLGLPICKTIIEEHGGEIGFMPNNLGGTTFF